MLWTNMCYVTKELLAYHVEGFQSHDIIRDRDLGVPWLGEHCSMGDRTDILSDMSSMRNTRSLGRFGNFGSMHP